MVLQQGVGVLLLLLEGVDHRGGVEGVHAIIHGLMALRHVGLYPGDLVGDALIHVGH